MSEQPGERLRDLARRYAEGQLSRGEYLSMRTDLLDAVTGVSQESTVGGLPAQGALADRPGHHEPLGDASALARAGAERPAAPVPAATGQRHALARTALGGVLTAAILAALWLVFPKPGPDTDVSTAAAPQTLGEGRPARPSAESRVEDFMARNDWSPPAIAGFLSTWDRLPESQRRAALGAAWFKPLADEVSERITAQQALVDSGGSEEYRALIDFAERLGLREEAIPPGEKL